MQVPLIDLHRPIPEIIELLTEACTTSGFFIIKNHTISTDLRQRVLQNCRQFFALPDEQKLTYKSEVLYTGYQPFGEIKVDKNSKKAGGDLREGHYACKGVPWVKDDGNQFWPDQWPPEEEVPGFASGSKEYAAASLILTRHLLELLSRALKQSENFLGGMMQKPFVALHNLHYAPVKSEPEKGVLGLGAHSDFGLLTLLTTDQPGLEIFLGDEWVQLDLEPNCIIVNLGDELQRCTNDRFKSMRHRVVTNGTDRYSVAFFVNADYDATLKCISACCSPDNPARYEPISSSAFMLEKFSAAHSA